MGVPAGDRGAAVVEVEKERSHWVCHAAPMVGGVIFVSPRFKRGAMQIEFIHLCDYAVVDTTGKLSVMGIFDTIGALKFPVVHASMYIAFQTMAVGAQIGIERDLRVEIADPDGKILFRAEGKVSTQGSNAPLNRVSSSHILRALAVQFAQPGTHGVTVFLDGKPAKEARLDVALLQPVTAQ